MNDQDQLLQDVAEALDDACIGGGAGLEDYELQRASEHVADVLFDAGYRKRPSVDTDGLAELIYGVNSGKYGDYCHHEETADAILAAGYRKPRMISTEVEAEALPVGSIVRDAIEMVWERWSKQPGPGSWTQTRIPGDFNGPILPITLVYTPEEPR